MEFDFKENALKGQTVLVAGGTGGLGSAVAALLARDGARILVGHCQDEERAEQLKKAIYDAYNVEISLIEGDLAKAETRRRWVAAADRLGEGIYGLVCATGDPGRVKFEEVTEADLHDSFDRNYVQPLLLAREAARAMQSRKIPGTVVFFSTMQAVYPFESSVNYAGPKIALTQVARILAKQWGGPGGIRVNVVAPGVNRAGMALQSIASGKYDVFVEKGIIPRFGRAEDVARVVRLMVEPDNYLTGQIITVDGGLTLRKDIG